jgi:signal transduction histidine kinase
MKLLVKTSLYYLILTLAVFGVGGLITYDVFHDEVERELDRYLLRELWKVEAAMENGIPASSLINENIQICMKEGEGIGETPPVFLDTIVFHPYLKRMEPNRKVTATKQVGSQFYHISLFDVIVETDDIYDGVVRSLTRIFALLAAVVTLFSVIFSRRLLLPFEDTLQKIQAFRIRDPHPIHFSRTRTREFTDLNKFISQMTEKVRLDYLNLKEFNENASHEMQTPLAIAKGKLELLLEANDLNADQAQLIGSAYSAINKLSRLGRSLSLLSKIQNWEFADTKELPLSEHIESTLIDFKELIEMKNLSLNTDIMPKVWVNMDPELADMLLTNLVQNAIRHNYEGGQIYVSLDPDTLLISNTGPAPSIPPEQFFERFKKSNQSNESIGLGLAIVKKICEVNKFEISYKYTTGQMHEIRVVFQPE